MEGLVSKSRPLDHFGSFEGGTVSSFSGLHPGIEEGTILHHEKGDNENLTTRKRKKSPRGAQGFYPYVKLESLVVIRNTET